MATGPRDRLIDSSIALVRAHGVDATGLTALLEHSGTARRSIYQHFPDGKDELIAASTRAAGSWVRRVLRDLRGQGDVASSVVLVFDEIARHLEAEGFTLGCPIAAAAAADSPLVRTAAAEVFQGCAEEVTAALIEEGHDPAEADSLAGFVISAVEGAMMRARSERTATPLREAGRYVAQLLQRSSVTGR